MGNDSYRQPSNGETNGCLDAVVSLENLPETIIKGNDPEQSNLSNFIPEVLDRDTPICDDTLNMIIAYLKKEFNLLDDEIELLKQCSAEAIMQSLIELLLQKRKDIQNLTKILHSYEINDQEWILKQNVIESHDQVIEQRYLDLEEVKQELHNKTKELEISHKMKLDIEEVWESFVKVSEENSRLVNQTNLLCDKLEKQSRIQEDIGSLDQNEDYVANLRNYNRELKIETRKNREEIKNLEEQNGLLNDKIFSLVKTISTLNRKLTTALDNLSLKENNLNESKNAHQRILNETKNKIEELEKKHRIELEDLKRQSN